MSRPRVTAMKCKEHPTYKGIQKSRHPECETCHFIYIVNHGIADSPIPKFNSYIEAMSFMDWLLRRKKK